MKKAIACLLALPLALAACGVQNVPAQTAQPTDTPVETPAPTTASTAPVEEPAASSEPAPESTPAQGEQMPAAPDQAAQESELASYTQTLGCFFNTPLQSTKELPQDYYLSFFLLYQTFESKGEGSTYTQNDNYFWEIPESDLLQTAAIYLGLSDLSISDITEWPFGEPQNGICYYSQETSLPYGDITVTNVKIDTATSKAQVFAEAGDTQFEDSTRQSMALVYHFTCTAAVLADEQDRQRQQHKNYHYNDRTCHSQLPPGQGFTQTPAVYLYSVPQRQPPMQYRTASQPPRRRLLHCQVRAWRRPQRPRRGYTAG